MSTFRNLFGAVRKLFSSKPPVSIKILTPLDARAGDPIWFDIQNNCNEVIDRVTIDCAYAYRNPAGMSFFRFNTLQELPPETFLNVLPGANRVCSHYQIPQNRVDKIYLGLVIVKALIHLQSDRQITIQKIHVNALPTPGHTDVIMPSSTFPASGNYITDLPGNFLKRIVDAIKDRFSVVGRHNIKRMKKEFTDADEDSSAPSSGKSE
jgi:hypothetical protein